MWCDKRESAEANSKCSLREEEEEEEERGICRAESV
jgi:hypothetical protein